MSRIKMASLSVFFGHMGSPFLSGLCALHVSWFVQNYIFDGTILMTTTPLGDKSEKLGRIIIRSLPNIFFLTHKTPDGYVLKIDINSYWNSLQRLTILMR